MTNLLKTENILRKIVNSPKEKFADNLQLNFFSTIYEVLLQKGTEKKIKNFMYKYEEYKNYSYSELEKENFYFEHLFEDLYKFY